MVSLKHNLITLWMYISAIMVFILGILFFPIVIEAFEEMANQGNLIAKIMPLFFFIWLLVNFLLASTVISRFRKPLFRFDWRQRANSI